jgi:hypothetical protein
MPKVPYHFAEIASFSEKSLLTTDLIMREIFTVLCKAL